MAEKWKQRAIHMNFGKAVIIFLITGFVLTISLSAALYGNFRSRIIEWEQAREADREWETEGRSQETEEGFQEAEGSIQKTEGSFLETERISREEEAYREGEDFSREERERFRENERDSRENDEFRFNGRERERDFKESQGRGRKEREEKDLEDMLKGIPLSGGDFALLAVCAAAGAALGAWYWILVMIWSYRKAYRIGVNGRLAVLAALFFNLAAVAALYLYGMLKGTCANCGRVRSRSGKFCVRCGRSLKKECPQCRQEVDVLSAYCRYCGRKLDETEEAKGTGEAEMTKGTRETKGAEEVKEPQEPESFKGEK